MCYLDFLSVAIQTIVDFEWLPCHQQHCVCTVQGLCQWQQEANNLAMFTRLWWPLPLPLLQTSRCGTLWQSWFTSAPSPVLPTPLRWTWTTSLLSLSQRDSLPQEQWWTFWGSFSLVASTPSTGEARAHLTTFLLSNVLLLSVRFESLCVLSQSAFFALWESTFAFHALFWWHAVCSFGHIPLQCCEMCRRFATSTFKQWQN